MKLLTNIFFTSLLSLLVLSNISYAQPNVQVLNYSHGKYVGEALNGKANGQGTYTSKSGVIYQGQFINDTFSGNGTMFWTNGDKFVGTWNNDSAVNGTMSFANGSSAQGTVRNAIFYVAQSSSPPTNQNIIVSKKNPQSVPSNSENCKKIIGLTQGYAEAVASKVQSSASSIRFIRAQITSDKSTCDIVVDTPIGPMSCIPGDIAINQKGEYLIHNYLKINDALFNISGGSMCWRN